MKGIAYRATLHRTTTIVMIATCLLTYAPQQGMCSELSIEQVAFDLSPSHFDVSFLSASTYPMAKQRLENSFQNLIDVVGGAEDPLATTQRFLQVFVDQMNRQNHTSLSVEEVYRLLREHQELVPPEYRDWFHAGVDALECNGSPDPALFSAATIYWPWEWNWFGWNKRVHSPQHISRANKGIPPEVLLVALMIVGITVVAIYNSPAVPVAVEAMIKVVTAIL